MKPIEIAKSIITQESKSILELIPKLNNDFIGAINSILSSKGKVVVIGMGKSGIIGKKIAATMASTGTPSFFIHPGEAFHGDLGMIESEDIVLLLSNSGETDEVLKILPFLKHNGNITICLTGNLNSTLAKECSFKIYTGVDKEACPLNLAPTSSTTATLVMGDAIALTIMKLNKFSPESFARFHPGGSLGKKLLYKVKDVMVTKDLPIVHSTSGMKDVVSSITEGRLGMTLICEKRDKIIGIITDGDLRRAIDNNQEDFFNMTAGSIMTNYPKTISSEINLFQAYEELQKHKVGSLIVIDHNKIFLGVFNTFNSDAL
jgi:arabinose-5-phosphate isomerase